MGGEKLKSSRTCIRSHSLVAAFFLTIAFFAGPFHLFAQDQGQYAAETELPAAPVPGTGIDETTIILGETLIAPPPVGRSSVFIVVQMVLVLALTALAIYGVVFFLKRLAKPQVSRDPHLKILARTALSTDTYAAVLSLGSKAWLVAGGSGNVNLISEITEQESLETMLLEDSQRTAESGALTNFRSLLRRFGVSQESGANLPGSHIESLRKQRERLRGQ